jgi:hypothetical protein
MKIHGTPALANLTNSPANVLIRLWTGKKRITPGAKIESGATDEYWYQTTAFNVLDLCDRFARPLTSSVVYFRRDKINQVMRNAFPFFERNFGSGDLNSLVNLHGVAVNDLATQTQR